MMKLGVFTDAHYAAGVTELGTRTCSRSLDKVKRILDALSGEVDAFVQLGDLINVSGSAEEDEKNIRAMQNLLNGCGKDCMSVLGNHDVEAARKSVYLPQYDRGYYSFDADGTRFIVLDGNFVSSGESYEDVEWDWTDSLIPQEELDWLDRTLDSAERAVVFCHQNLDERPGDPHVIGNAGKVREILEASGRVTHVLQGHCHSGCVTEKNGIVYHTFRALCEGSRIPCAVVTVEDGRVYIEERELSGE